MAASSNINGFEYPCLLLPLPGVDIIGQVIVTLFSATDALFCQFPAKNHLLYTKMAKLLHLTAETVGPTTIRSRFLICICVLRSLSIRL